MCNCLPSPFTFVTSDAAGYQCCCWWILLFFLFLFDLIFKVLHNLFHVRFTIPKIIVHCRSGNVAGRLLQSVVRPLIIRVRLQALRLRSYRHESEYEFPFTGCLSLVQAHDNERILIISSDINQSINHLIRPHTKIKIWQFKWTSEQVKNRNGKVMEHWQPPVIKITNRQLRTFQKYRKINRTYRLLKTIIIESREFFTKKRNNVLLVVACVN